MLMAIKNMLTGKDNQTHDVVRFGLLLATLLGVIVTIMIVYYEHTINLMQVAGYFSSLFTATGVSLKIKETTEPT